MKFEYLEKVKKEHIHLFQKKNEPYAVSNGIFIRYKNSVITADHIPLHWRYDLNPASNPFEMERIGVNVAFNSGLLNGRINIYFAYVLKAMAENLFYHCRK